MHLHAWNSPPLHQLTADDYRYQPYLIEYPELLIRKKVEFLTQLLGDTFGVKPTSHRAGRWSFNEVYARILVEFGYRVDCSVTPHVSWRLSKGDPAQPGGTDFSRFSDEPYTVDLEDISRAGDSSLLELPMTILRGNPVLQRVGSLLPQRTLPSRAWNLLFPPVRWLRPNGRNRRQMVRIVEQVLQEGRSYAEFMLHSSEFMPGGSPNFRTADSVERLYGDLEHLFSHVATKFAGATLGEFDASVRAEQGKVRA
jgi:hypothetical protein